MLHLPTHPTLRTAIICTIGPASSDAATIGAMIDAGMSVARLNFSHGTYDEHQGFVERIRAEAASRRRNVAILQDLQGPKVRVGSLPKEGVPFRIGEEVTFSTAEHTPAGAIPVDVPTFHHDVRPGDTVLLDDGVLACRVTAASGTEVRAVVTAGGVLRSHKGIGVPGGRLGGEAITPKDAADLRFGLEMGVDLVALSFVRHAADVDQLRALISLERRTLHQAPSPGIITKIEKHEAVADLEAIAQAADGLMVARGDLALDIPQERVPVVQKDIVGLCRHLGKPAIVATQMLESMTQCPRPTRAELTDVANAVWDGGAAVMLSGETAGGAHPVLAVKTMADVVGEAEASRYYRWGQRGQ
jgi:pyruvate kinase